MTLIAFWKNLVAKKRREESEKNVKLKKPRSAPNGKRKFTPFWANWRLAATHLQTSAISEMLKRASEFLNLHLLPTVSRKKRTASFVSRTQMTQNCGAKLPTRWEEAQRNASPTTMPLNGTSHTRRLRPRKVKRG